MSLFLNLLSELQNPEKTRNFNVFKNYSLDEFQSQIERYGKLLEFDPSISLFVLQSLGRMEREAHLIIFRNFCKK